MERNSHTKKHYFNVIEIDFSAGEMYFRGGEMYFIANNLFFRNERRNFAPHKKSFFITEKRKIWRSISRKRCPT